MLKSPFVGAWRIAWMSGWDQDYVDMEAPGRFTFKTSKSGSFQFGLIQAEMDCRIARQQRIEFT